MKNVFFYSILDYYNIMIARKYVRRSRVPASACVQRSKSPPAGSTKTPDIAQKLHIEIDLGEEKAYHAVGVIDPIIIHFSNTFKRRKTMDTDEGELNLKITHTFSGLYIYIVWLLFLFVRLE